MAPTAEDRARMGRAMRLAARGAGATHPNPMVGAVLVKKGRVVGEGWHRKAGEPHAEVLAIGHAGRRARGATLYVNLEPCAHHGRTPPCTGAIVEAGINRVVVGCLDTNPRVNGRGVEILKSAGIRVDVGVCEDVARELNRAFLHFTVAGMPYVTLKLGSTLDGRIATAGGESRWITGEESRRTVHRLRSAVDAVLVGVGTLLADDPRLDARGVGSRRQPTRIVLDGDLRLPDDSHLVRTAGQISTLVFAGRRAPAGRIRHLEKAGVEVVRLPRKRGFFGWQEMGRELMTRNLCHIMVEGGGVTAAWFLREKAASRLELFAAPRVLGADGIPALGPLGIAALADAPRLDILRSRKRGPDLHVSADLVY